MREKVISKIQAEGKIEAMTKELDRIARDHGIDVALTPYAPRIKEHVRDALFEYLRVDRGYVVPGCGIPEIKNTDFIFRRYNVELEGPAIPIEDTPEVKAAAPKAEPFKSLALAVVKGDTDAVLSKVKDALVRIKPLDLIEKGLAKGMDAVGALYASGTYFLPNVMVSADAMMAGIAECERALGKATEKKGKVVCHVAEGDPHDIGKNLIVMFLRAAGYDVTDLGRDVPIETVVDTVKREKPMFLTGTALMTTTMSSFPKIAAKLKQAGIDVTFGCGGGALSKEWVESFDMGVFGDKAYHAPKLADAILKGMGWKDLRVKYSEVVGEYTTGKGW